MNFALAIIFFIHSYVEPCNATFIIHIQAFLHYLHESALHAFAEAFQPISVRCKTMLTVAGKTECYLYFVTEGLQRICYLTESGKESTL